MVPRLFLVAAIGTGARSDRRRGGARHARPPAREIRSPGRRVVLEKSAALVIRSPGSAWCSGSPAGSSAPSVGWISRGGSAAGATLGAVLLALAYGAMAVVLGCRHRATRPGDRGDCRCRRRRLPRQRPRAARRRARGAAEALAVLPLRHRRPAPPGRLRLALGRPGRDRGRGDRARPGALLAP